jgi:hypothetical protein
MLERDSNLPGHYAMWTGKQVVTKIIVVKGTADKD